jgi:uracil-DNA glycosylase
MKQKLDLEEIKEKLYARLEPSGWAVKLRSFIYSSDFDNIITQLARLSMDGKRFTPTLKQMFRAFEECPVNELKVVIVGQDPYPQIGVADGVAFSCGNTMELQPSLTYMLDEINRTVYKGHPGSLDVDLTRWSNQGILLLNTALTTTVGKIGQHYALWKPFMAYLFDYLTWNESGIVYVYMGKQAKEWSEAVNDNNYKFFVTHPASAAYANQARWDSDNVFVKVNEVVERQFNTKITW